jgi:hypothetical protein
MKVILIEGGITRKMIDTVKSNILSLHQQDEVFTMSIDSQGGEIKPIIEFVEFMNSQPTLYGLKRLKIYNSGSAASFLALSLRVPKEMRRKSSFGLHLGSIGRVEFAELDSEGRIPKDKFDFFLNFFDRQMNLVFEHKLLKTSEIRTLLTTGFVAISSLKCFNRGFIEKRF